MEETKEREGDRKRRSRVMIKMIGEDDLYDRKRNPDFDKRVSMLVDASFR